MILIYFEGTHLHFIEAFMLLLICELLIPIINERKLVPKIYLKKSCVYKTRYLKKSCVDRTTILEQSL